MRSVCGWARQWRMRQALVPKLHIVEAAPGEDEAALLELARWCIGYSPVVAPCPPDGIWIDIAGSSALFGGEEKLVADLLRRLAAQGIHARASVADAPGAAWAMARYGEPGIVPPGQIDRCGGRASGGGAASAAGRSSKA